MTRKIVGGVLFLTCMNYDPLVEEHFFRGTEEQVRKAIKEVVIQ